MMVRRSALGPVRVSSPSSLARSALVSLCLLGCGAPHESAVAAHDTTSGSGELVPVGAELPVGSYEVHEWGLVRAGMNDVLDVGAIPPRVAHFPMAVDKPVLYFHANGAVRIATVGVESIGGSIREHWPLTTHARMPPTAIAWRDLTIDGTSIVGASSCALAFPTLADRPCTDLERGEHCESADLVSARAIGAACIGVDGATAPFLFYRSRTSTFTPPLRVERAGSDMRATNAGEAAIPGWIVRLRSEGGQVRALAVRPPAPGETIVIGDDFASADAPATDETTLVDRRSLPGSAGPGRRAVEDTMREIGLTPEEIAAFLRAWDDTLFALPARAAAGMPVDDMPVDVLTQDGEPGPIDSVLYFLPESACDGVARLTFDPPPLAVRRALAVWARIL